MDRKLRPIRKVLDSLKAIRRRPVPAAKIEEFNRIVEKDDEFEHAQKKKKDPSRKIARAPEADA